MQLAVLLFADVVKSDLHGEYLSPMLDSLDGRYLTDDAAPPEDFRPILDQQVALHRNDGDHCDQIVGRRVLALA